jgi:FixJ family two-component response regulator
MVHSPCIIAVVDDDSRVLESLESLLESNGLKVRLFPSADEFLSSKALSKIDCLISDIGMPDVSGMNLLAIIRQETPHIPVILITGRPVHESAEYYTAQGAHAFFLKPFDGRALLDSVREAIEARQGLPPKPL